MFYVRTLHTTTNRHQQTAQSSIKTSFASVRFEGLRWLLESQFPVKSAGGKCERFAHHGRRQVYLPFISYI